MPAPESQQNLDHALKSLNPLVLTEARLARDELRSGQPDIMAQALERCKKLQLIFCTQDTSLQNALARIVLSHFNAGGDYKGYVNTIQSIAARGAEAACAIPAIEFACTKDKNISNLHFIRAVAAIGDPAGLPFLIRQIKNDSAAMAAAEAVRKIDPKGERVLSLYVTAINEGLDPKVKISAIKILFTIGFHNTLCFKKAIEFYPAATSKEECLDCLTIIDKNVCLFAKSRNWPTIVTIWREACQAFDSDYQKILEKYRESEPIAALAVLKLGLKQDSSRCRRVAAHALNEALNGDPDTLAILEQLTDAGFNEEWIRQRHAQFGGRPAHITDPDELFEADMVAASMLRAPVLRAGAYHKILIDNPLPHALDQVIRALGALDRAATCAIPELLNEMGKLEKHGASPITFVDFPFEAAAALIKIAPATETATNALAIFRKHLKDGDEFLDTAFPALTRQSLAPQELQEQFLALLSHQDSEILGRAIVSMREIDPAHPSLIEPTMRFLAQSMSSDSDRKLAASILGSFGPAAIGAVPLLKQALVIASEKARREIEDAIRKITSPA